MDKRHIITQERGVAIGWKISELIKSLPTNAEILLGHLTVDELRDVRDILLAATLGDCGLTIVWGRGPRT